MGACRFNPRTPCGVRPCQEIPRKLRNQFQSTHSLRSATGDLGTDDPEPTVSIHALLAECDPRTTKRNTKTKSFNPRTPCGVRQMGVRFGIRRVLFQSTHSLRSATTYGAGLPAAQAVSIHALLAECDCFNISGGVDNRCFNPRTPCGVRHDCNLTCLRVLSFQSTHSLRSATEGGLNVPG